ncbi:MAG: branched-chain amino acid ABC transporter permease, partial [Chloroflexi bacterium]|nr:branched-chain amino acid ABC transporter permease [Chloroflexota bacterium]
FDWWKVSPYLSLPASALVLFVTGALIQKTVVAKVVGQPELTSLLLTFGVSILLQNLQLELFTADYRSTPYLTGSFAIGGLAIPLSRLAAAALAVVITTATYVFLKTSVQGKAIRATSQHPDVAAVCGIDVDRVRMIAFGLGASLAGTAGSLMITIYSVNPESGRLFMLKAFSCIVLGGMGNFLGAFAGGIILGVSEAFGGFLLNPQLAEAIGYVILVAVLLVRPNGILAGARR